MFSPLSGSEPEYDPDQWNDNMKYNNCTAYAFNDHKPFGRDKKPVPGHQQVHYNCQDLEASLFEDVPELKKTTFQERCPAGYHKIYLTVSSEKENDFHFYRQDQNGYWSHKPGSLPVTNLDARKQKIINPETADRRYPYRHYNQSCAFYCAPQHFDRDALNRE